MAAAKSEIMDRMRTAFRAEALDLLPELDAALLAMELEPHNAALVNRVFRAMHTIKGSGATAGFVHLAHFAHGVEEAFDLARSGKLPITSDLIDCGLKACDVIREILDMEDEGHDAAGERAVSDALARLLPGAPSSVPPKDVAPQENALSAYAIFFRPGTELFRSGADPAALLEELRDLGMAKVTAHVDALPSLSTLNAEECCLWWSVVLLTESGEDAIRDVFLFVADECLIDIRLLPNQTESIDFLMLPMREHSVALDRITQAAYKAAVAALLSIETATKGIEQYLSGYLQAMHKLAAAAVCEQRTDLADAASFQARILARVLRVGLPMSSQDGVRLRSALEVLHANQHHRQEVRSCA